MLSSLSSIVNSPLKIVLVVLAVAVIVLSGLLKRAAGKTSPGTSSWKSYIKSQGMLLFVFLMIGGVLAWTSSKLGPSPDNVTTGGKLVEYRNVDPSKNVIVMQQAVQNYHHITIFAQAAAPLNSSASITIYGESTQGGKHEIGRIDATAGAWSRWERQNSSNNLTITIATGAGVSPATQVDVLVFLSSE